MADDVPDRVDAVAVAIRDAKTARTVFLLDIAVERLGTEAARRWTAEVDEEPHASPSAPR